jgi:hypothetical protein
MNQKIFNKKARITYFEISILLINIFAIAYLICSATESVDAAVPGYGCCEETKKGNSCQYVPSADCNLNFVPTECSQTSYCQKGCCISKETGKCSSNSAQRDCIKGIWKEDGSCNYQECKNICCILGEQGTWATEKSCEIESSRKGLPVNINRNVKSDIECIYLAGKTDKGACIYYSDELKKCMFATREECYAKTRNYNDFYKGIYCSEPQLNTSCKPREKTNCLENKEEVYWFDSCGNPEKIYQNCSILSGGICGKYREGIDKKSSAGDYVCRDLNCRDKNGITRKNGESWCEYDGKVGDGKDSIGSRHIKHMCFMGEDKIELCDDYRNQICVASETDIGNGKTFSEASCRVNNWRSCFEYNTLENGDEMAKKCRENPDCFIKEVYIDEYFQFASCVPHYPPGFDLRGNSGLSAELTCNFGSVKCTYAKENTIGSQLFGWCGFCGSWIQPKETNKNCLNPEFAEKMNDLCVSLGDCGAYVNYNGDVNDEGYSVINSPRLSNTYLTNLKGYSKKDYNQKNVPPGNLTFLGVLGKPENLGEIPSEEKPFISSFESILLGTTGAAGVPYLLDSIAGKTGIRIVGATAEFLGISPGILAPFLNGAAASFAGAVVGIIAVKLFGLNGEAAIATSLSGAIAFFLMSYFQGFNLIAWNVLLSNIAWTALVVVIIASILDWLKVGKIETTIVEFKCLASQPLNGGENCNKCGKDGVPCTDYRCRSLGKTCEIINKGSENEICVNNPPTDITSPNIKPLYEVISESYEYSNEKEGKDGSFEIIGKNENCIEPFTNIIFGIKTLDSSGKDKPAICKIGYNPAQDYEDMDFFGGINLNLVNHTMILNVPSPEAFKNQYNLTEEQAKQVGEVKFYVKCQGINGQRNLAPYTIKTCVKPAEDLTPPIITKTIPENKAFVKYEANQQQLRFFVNEPSQCKWSKEDKNYLEMENNIDCQTLLETGSINGWECRTNLTGLINNKKFYIKCRDVSKNNNTMTESLVYELISSSNLVIDEIEPLNNIIINSGVEPASLTLKVKTSGGAENGKSICSWTGNGYSDRFRENSNLHSYALTSLGRGNYGLSFICEDTAGNAAEASTYFKVNIDDIGPRITRILYKDGLKIFTDEKAECRYSFNDNAVFENFTLMTGTKLEHTANWQLRTYFVQCKDEFGNKGERIEIRTYD